MHKEDMLYNGVSLQWYHHGLFRATSGLKDHQNADQQSHTDEGPIPEGLYHFPLILAKDGTMVGPGQLDGREGVEHLPDKFRYGKKEFLNNAWGADRVRLTIDHIDDVRNRHRGGFYLHDSTKGFSHGCIEVDPKFFLKLRAFVKLPSNLRGEKKHLYLKVKYPSAHASTYGNTKLP